MRASGLLDLARPRCPSGVQSVRRQDTLTSLDFLNEIITAFPFPIRKVQTDNGSEFSFTFLLAVERRGIRHRYIKPRRPDQNGKVERSHRVDTEGFWGRHSFASFEAAAVALPGWEREYNEGGSRWHSTGGRRRRNSQPCARPLPDAETSSALTTPRSPSGRGP